MPPPCPAQLHVAMDGVLIFVGGQWREVKCAVAYETSKDDQGQAKGVQTARYYGTLARSWAFGPRVRTLAHEAGSGRCSGVAVGADGAEWIWQETGKHFPQSVQVLDFYPACEHLWLVARARFGEGSPAGAEWMHQQKERLLEGKVARVRAAVQDGAAPTQAGPEVRRQVAAYLATHAHRMDYARLRKSGWHIGSGVAQAACKGVVQGRLQGVGMRWSQAGAEALLHVRPAWCRRGPVDFMDAARQSLRPS